MPKGRRAIAYLPFLFYQTRTNKGALECILKHVFRIHDGDFLTCYRVDIHEIVFFCVRT